MGEARGEHAYLASDFFAVRRRARGRLAPRNRGGAAKGGESTVPAPAVVGVEREESESDELAGLVRTPTGAGHLNGRAETAVSRRLTASVNTRHVSPTGGTHLSDSLFSGLKRSVSAPRYRLAPLLVVFCALPQMWYRSVTLAHNVMILSK